MTKNESANNLTPEQRVNRLVDRLFDDQHQSKETIAELNDLLHEDIALQKVYLKRTSMHAMLNRHSQLMVSIAEYEGEPQGVVEEIDALAAVQSSRHASDLQLKRPGFQFRKHYWAAAAVLFMISMAVLLRQSERQSVWYQSVETIRWNTQAPEQPELEIGKDYSFHQGKLQLTFSHGVRAVLDSPASFRINDHNEIEMRRGLIAVHVPKTAIGFSIRTEMGLIEDRGTAFGVDVRSDAVDLHVISGEVAVKSREQPDQVLKTQKALRMKQESDELVLADLDYGMNEFRDLQHATGVDYLLNAVMHYGDMFNIHVYDIFIVVPELRQYRLSRDMTVQTPDFNTKVIPRGTLVTSYLVLSPRRSEKAKPVPGWCEVRFKRQVDGLIMNDQLLRRSNELLGLKTMPKHPKQQHIGLEGRYEHVTLSENGRYLTFQGKYMYDYGDQFRVIMIDERPE